MVRKRTRTSKKQYESEEDEDSDLELDLEEVTNTLAPKKYSLRQRKRPLFTEAFDDDFEDAEEIEQLIRKKHSDDEDFEVEKEIVELQEAAKSAPKPHQHTRKKSSPQKQNTEVTQDTYYEPPPEAESQVEEADGMIDFEDMIRADIVVNKNRIDYDNVICSSEIKVDTPEEDGAKTYPKRASKPRKRYDEEIDTSLLEPELEVEEAEFDDDDVNDKDYNPADDLILPSQCLQTEIQESDSNIETTVNGSCDTANGIQSLNKQDAEQTCLAIIDKYTVENNGPSLSEQIVAQTTEIPSILPEQILEINKPDEDHKDASSEATVLEVNKQEPDLKPVVSPVTLNGSLPEETPQKTVVEEIMIVEVSDDEEDDDDVLIIEPKHEVIVLDD